MTVAYDRPGSKCLGVQPGTKALRDECLSLFDQSEDAGIYNCRHVRGGSSPSVHSEGRAWDAHFDQPGRGLRNPAGDELAWFLVDQHDLLSVQVVIWAKRIWSVTKPYWRSYGGAHDHLDHVHVEQNWHGAKKCTRATVRLAFQRWLGVVPTPEEPEEEVKPYVILNTETGHSYLVHPDALLWIADGESFNSLTQAFGAPLRVSNVQYQLYVKAVNNDVDPEQPAA